MPIKQTSSVSVDIGHSNLKLVQTSADGRIVKFSVHKLPDGCVDDLNILSEESLIKALKTARKTARLPRCNCNLVISGSNIIIRHFTLPILEEADLYQNVLHEMVGYLPVDPEKYYVDYKIVEKINEDNIEMYKVMVTTAHKRIVNNYKKVLRAAGYNAKVIDTCENSKEKILRYNDEHDEDFSIEGGICIIDFGKNNTRVNIYNNGYYYVSNVLKRSSQSITDLIVKNSGKDILSAETMKREVNLLTKDHSNDKLKSAVMQEVDALVYEIVRVFDYFRNRTKSNIQSIYISGGGSLLPGLKDYMEELINMPVHFASDLIINKKTKKSVDSRAFSFLLNAYTASFREEIQ